MEIASIRHGIVAPPHFIIGRPHGASEFVFLHFYDPVEIIMNGETFLTKPHACMIYQPGTPQHYSAEKGFFHDWMHLTGNVREILQKYELPIDEPFYPPETRFVTEIMCRLEQEFFSQKRYYDDYIRMKTEELFLKLSRTLRQELPPMPDSDLREKLTEFRIELLADVQRQWTTAEMAERFLMSESRFYAVYKMTFGISPNQDLIIARIERAKQLLILKQYNVNEIAAMTGYTNVNHFIRQFKARTSVTPKSYQRYETDHNPVL